MTASALGLAGLRGTVEAPGAGSEPLLALALGVGGPPPHGSARPEPLARCRR